LAKGNINCCRFVRIDPATDNGALQCGDNLLPIGISYEGTNYPPLSDQTTSEYAAQADEYLGLYGNGDICLIEAGDAVVRGNRLKSDSVGRGVPIATAGAIVQQCGARALESASAAGEKIRVQVELGATYPATYQ